MKKMKSLIFSAILLGAVAGCARLPVYQAEYVSNPQNIGDPQHYDKKGKIKYDVYNDDKNVYVSIKTLDYYAQVKILKFGLTLWLDEKGKKKKEKGIVFPMESGFQKPTQSQGGQRMMPGGKESLLQLHSMYELSDKNILLIGFDGKDSKRELYPKRETYDISATITFDSLNNALNYLAVIPIDKIISKDDNDKTFSIGLESGFLDMGNMPGPGMRGGMRPGGMGGGMGGGMPGGGMPGGGMGGRGGMKGGMPGGHSMATMRTALTTPVKVWFAAKLSE